MKIRTIDRGHSARTSHAVQRRLPAGIGVAAVLAFAAGAGADVTFIPLSSAKNYNDGRSNTAARGLAADGKASVYETWDGDEPHFAGLFGPNDAGEDMLWEMPLPNGAIGSEIHQFRQKPGRGAGDPIKGVGVGVIRKIPPYYPLQAAAWDTRNGVPGTVHELSNGLGVASEATSLNADASLFGGAIYRDVFGDGILRPLAVVWDGVGADPISLHFPDEYTSSVLTGLSADGTVGACYGAINEQGIQNDDPKKKKAAVWKNGHVHVIDPDSDTFSAFTAISDDGSTAIGYKAINEKGVQYGVVANLASEVLVALPAGDFNNDGIEDIAHAYAINGDGSLVVGSIGFGGGDGRAAIWSVQNDGQTAVMMEDLWVVMAGAAPQGWTLNALTGISADGRTVSGWGVNPQGFTEGFIATIPSPGTGVISGVSGLLAVRRRRA